MQDYPSGYGATLRFWSQDQPVPGQDRGVEIRVGSNPTSCKNLLSSKYLIFRGSEDGRVV